MQADQAQRIVEVSSGIPSAATRPHCSFHNMQILVAFLLLWSDLHFPTVICRTIVVEI